MSNTKGNRQFQETHSAILQTVLQLLDEEDLRQVTVAEVCRRVGVNRSTFYEHYLDIRDVIESTESEYARQMAELISEALPSSRRDAALAALRFVRDHRGFYARFLALGNQMHIPDELLGEDLTARKAEVLADGGIAPVAATYRLEFLKGGMNAVIRAWLEDGCLQSEETLLGMLSSFINVG